MILNDVEKNILKYCDNKYEPMKALYNEIPRSTVYRWVRALLKKGYLEKMGNTYKTTSRGQSALEEDETEFNWNMLEQEVPHLKHITNILQRCLIEIFLPAMIARRDEILKNHHPTFVLFGPTYKGKTWTVELFCHILGLDPVKHIHKTMAESGNSTLFRKGSDGKLAWKSEILTSQLVCFDEYHEAKKKVRDNNKVYIQGELYMTIEDEEMKIEPVTILIYNPKNGEELGARIKFEDQNTRRAIICDFFHVHIDERERRNGEKILKKIQDTPPLTLLSHKSDCEKYRDIVYTFLPTCLKDECGFIIDCEMVLMLCAGMTAYLPEKNAVLVILHRYLTIIETLGYLKDNWRDMLDKEVKRILNDELEGERGEKSDGLNQRTLSENRNSLPFDLNYDLKIQKIKESLDSSKVDIAKFSTFLDKYVILNVKGFNIDQMSALFDSFGLSDIENAVEAIQKYGDIHNAVNEQEKYLKDNLAVKVSTSNQEIQQLYTKIKSLGSTPERITSLMKIQYLMDDLHLDINSLQQTVSILKEFDAMGLSLPQARKLAEEMERQGMDKSSIKKIVTDLVAFGNLKVGITESQQNIKTLKNQKKELEGKTEEERMELNDIQIERSDLEKSVQFLTESKENVLDSINNLVIQKIKAKSQVRSALKIKDEVIDISSAVDSLKHEKEQLESEKLQMISDKEDLQKELDGPNEMKELVLGWREFLFDDLIPSYHSVYNDFEKLVGIHKGEMDHLKSFERMYSENIRRTLVELFLKKVDSDLLPKWRYKDDLERDLNIIKDLKDENVKLQDKIDKLEEKFNDN